LPMRITAPHSQANAVIGKHLVQSDRLFSEARWPTSFCRCRAIRRNSRNAGGGVNDPRSGSARASVASHCASPISVLHRGGAFLTCGALTTWARMSAASSAAYGLFQ
jgi:hypothetical protein